MESLILQASSRTPQVQFDINSGEFFIKGKSIPDNSVEFYKPVFEWLTKYFENPLKSNSITFALDYYNTSSAKCLADILKKIQAVYVAGGCTIEIIWVYQEFDEDMLEAGEEFKSSLTVPFTLSGIK